MTKTRNYLRRILIILMSCSVFMLLSACGQKGPLYLPKNVLTGIENTAHF